MNKVVSNKTNILMCCSDLSVKGGMVSVVKNYVEYQNWGDINIIFIPTHIEKNKIIKGLFFLISYLRIICLCISKKIKIAHLHVSERGSFFRKALIARLCKKCGVKVILHHHGAEFDEFYSNLNDKNKRYINLILEIVDCNIVLSKGLISMIINKAPNANVKVLYNAVKTYYKNPYNKNAKNILFLGRLGKRKGTYDLIEAIKFLDNKINKDIKVYLCGDGEIDRVKGLIKKYNLSDRITYVGWVDKDDIKDIFSKSAINVLPSYNEGLPMTILETMAYGIPNISTNIASIPEVINDVGNGYLINPGNVGDLINKLKVILSNEKLRLEFSNKSYNLIKNDFSLDSHVEKLISIWKNLI